MPEISNKMLAVLLALAIVISVGGAVLTITQVTNLVNIIPALQGITGLGATGRVNVSVTTLAELTVATTSVDFGVGYVATGYSSVELNSSKAAPTGWTVSGTYAPTDMQIHNSGTVYVNVSVMSSATGAEMIGGTSPYIKFKPYENKSGSCAATAGSPSGLLRNLTTFAAINTEYMVCENLSYLDTADSLNISFVLLVPQDAVAGNKTALITFDVCQSPCNV